MPEPKHITHRYRDPAKAYNQNIAGLTKKQRARRERKLQEQLYNARVNLLARLMVNWLIAYEKGEEEKASDLLPQIDKLLKTFTANVAERILGAAQEAAEAQILREQNERVMAEFSPIPVQAKPEPVPYTQEELDALAAAAE